MRPLKNVQFYSSHGQFRRIAELDSRQAARSGEGHGRPESTRGILTTGIPLVFRG